MKEVYQSAPNRANILNADMFKSALPIRVVDAHKGTFGSVAIIGGDAGKVGATMLAARAALHSGAGRVYTAMMCKDAPSVDIVQPEIMMRTFSEVAALEQLDCVVIGPGLGQTKGATELLKWWLMQDSTLLLDADALNLISDHLYLVDLVKARKAETVMTPHPGEAARLLATNSRHIQKNRVESALVIAEKKCNLCAERGGNYLCTP